METAKTAMSLDVCQERKAGEQMPSLRNELEGEAQPTQGVGSDSGDTVDITVSDQASIPPSTEPSASISPSTEPSASIPPSTEPSASISPSTEPSASISPFMEPSASIPPSTEPTASISPSTEPSASISPSTEPTASISPSTEPSASISPFMEPSASIPPTMEPSASIPPSTEPSASISPTMEPSASISPSTEPSASIPPTVEPSASISPFMEPSASISPFMEPSASIPPTMEPSASISPFMEPSASIPPTVEPSGTSVSLTEQLTPHLPLQCSPSPPPLHPACMLTPIPAQAYASSPVNTVGQVRAPQPPQTEAVSYPLQASPSLPRPMPAPHPTQTEAVPDPLQASPSLPRQMPASHPSQTCPPIPAQSSAPPAVPISVLCFAPLPAQTPPPLQWAVAEEVSAHFEVCLEEVGALERRRDALVRELLQLEQPMMQAVQTLQAELVQAYGHLTRAQLQLLRLQEEMLQGKRKLFSVTRNCIQSEVELSALRYEVAQSVIMQEELQSDVLDHLQEAAQLREDHKKQMDSMGNNLGRRRRPRTMSDLSHCRRLSNDFSRYTRGNMKMLEEWYEPRLLALLRHRQCTEEVLRRSRGLTEELKTRLLPLQEETHKLTLQRHCLEQKIALMEQDREDSVTWYKESLTCLEESMRELKTEVQMQRRANTELKQLKNSLLLELQSYGCSISVGENADRASDGTEDV